MKNKRPVLVTFIADLNILNCILLLICLFPDFAKHLRIIARNPDLIDSVISILMIIVLSVTTYGLLKLRKWGYWLMVAYNMFFLIISILLVLRIIELEHIYQNLIPSYSG